MKIRVTSVFVDDQDKAKKFYTEILGIKGKKNTPLGTNRWLTDVSPEGPKGTGLLLEPSDHPAVGPYTAAIYADDICRTFISGVKPGYGMEKTDGAGRKVCHGTNGCGSCTHGCHSTTFADTSFR